jgi:hypothetical protein
MREAMLETDMDHPGNHSCRENYSLVWEEVGWLGNFCTTISKFKDSGGYFLVCTPWACYRSAAELCMCYGLAASTLEISRDVYTKAPNAHWDLPWLTMYRCSGQGICIGWHGKLKYCHNPRVQAIGRQVYFAVLDKDANDKAPFYCLLSQVLGLPGKYLMLPGQDLWVLRYFIALNGSSHTSRIEYKRHPPEKLVLRRRIEDDDW